MLLDADEHVADARQARPVELAVACHQIDQLVRLVILSFKTGRGCRAAEAGAKALAAAAEAVVQANLLKAHAADVKAQFDAQYIELKEVQDQLRAMMQVRAAD